MFCKKTTNGKPRLEPKSSNISRIAINHSSLSAVYLAKVVYSCKTLREFQYSLGGRIYIREEDENFSPRTLLYALLQHKKTLEILDLNIEFNISILDQLKQGTIKCKDDGEIEKEIY